MNLVGVDGCRGGWVAVFRRAGEFGVERWETLEPLFSQAWDQAMVDMPIGLPEVGRRACDQAARERLGAARSSVFFAPPRPLVPATDYEEVRSFGMSLQTFYLLPKIRELDGWMSPHAQRVVREAHPELAYRSRFQSLLSKKRTPQGLQQRQAILGSVGSPFLLEQWSSSFPRKWVALDDLLDAAILLLVAEQFAAGFGSTVGGRDRDSRGLKMEICF